ncbi:MAG: ribonuclease J [Clostridia bacterium]|nr:ribonuclease J [Clostridia bacterium]MDD4386928.1 ribonuclease J [Clostridia bacterium]
MINKTKKQNGEIVQRSTDEDVINVSLLQDISKKMNSNDKVQFEDNYIQHKNTNNNINNKTNNNNNKTNNNNNNNNNSSKSKLKIIPLGGLNEIGKNMTVFEYGNDIVVLDCGLAFPDDEMLGVDLVIPDITYLEKNKEKVRALVLTHGHEDHIGAIPYFLRKIKVPIYGTKLTLGLVKAKLIEHKLDKTTDFRYVNYRDIITIGKMKIEFIRVNHSIADASAIAITTPEGTVIHTGDFKIDFTPIDDEMIDLNRFAELGNQGVTLLMSDSTNVERPGYTMSEKNVGDEFDRLFLNCTKRIIVATFSSNIHRMQQVINTAVKCKRKVAVVGRSMVNVIKVGTELGYISAPEGTIIDIDKVGIYNPEQLVIITTGSQGEPMSALSRMAVGEHRKIAINPDDLIIFSSSAIPGNEKSINRVIDELEKLGAEVIYNELADVHVSGHACQEELKLMLSLVKPKYFMPVHGEFRFLKHHGELAASIGNPKENIFIMENGKSLEISNGVVKKGAQVPSGIVFIDGLGVGDVGNIVVKDRQLLSENGMIIVIITMDRKTANIVAGPEIVTRGFVYVRESEELMEEIKTVAREELELCIRNKQFEWSTIKSNVRESLMSYIYKKIKREPMILPIISEVDIDTYMKNKI